MGAIVIEWVIPLGFVLAVGIGLIAWTRVAVGLPSDWRGTRTAFAVTAAGWVPALVATFLALGRLADGDLLAVAVLAVSIPATVFCLVAQRALRDGWRGAGEEFWDWLAVDPGGDRSGRR